MRKENAQPTGHSAIVHLNNHHGKPLFGFLCRNALVHPPDFFQLLTEKLCRITTAHSKLAHVAGRLQPPSPPPLPQRSRVAYTDYHSVGNKSRVTTRIGFLGTLSLDIHERGGGGNGG